jgi:hypothetical protein
VRLPILVVLTVMLAGCAAIKTGRQSAVNVTGNWQMSLSESQATVVSSAYGNNNYPNTVVDLALVQTGTALSVSKAMIASAGCGRSASAAWWEIVGWNQNDLTNVSGTIEGDQLALRMNESNQGTGADGAQLSFTGTVSQDGKTGSGTLSDGCTGGQMVQWSAVRVSSFPESTR